MGEGRWKRDLFLEDESKTQRLAECLGAVLAPTDVLLLKGGLGVGKSTFSRYLIRSILGNEETIPSPTFTLVQEYTTQKGPLWHLDLYRLTDQEEIFDLGIETMWDEGMTLIEWPERLGTLAPPALCLDFSFTTGECQRRLQITGDLSWESRLSSIMAD